MVTGTPTPLSQLPTGTIDNMQAIVPMDIGMPSLPQTIQASLSQTAKFLQSQGQMISGSYSLLNGKYQPSGTYITGSMALLDGRYQPTGTGGGSTSEWTEVSDSWSYASASTITAPSDATTTYQKGDLIRFKQGGGYKYFVLIALTSTVLTLYGGSDYSVANSAITNIAYSRKVSAYGFPTHFNWTPSWNNLTVGNGTQDAVIKVGAGTVEGTVHLIWGSTTSIAGAISMSLPIAPPLVTGTSTVNDYFPVGALGLIDAATALYMGEVVLRGVQNIFDFRVIKADGTYATWASVTSTVPHTWASTDTIDIEFRYLY